MADTLVRLCELKPGDMGDFYALLVERVLGVRKDGQPFYTCQFRDAERTVTAMVWPDGLWFEECQSEWKEGTFFKLRARYEEHATWGPRLDVHDIRPVDEQDRQAGFRPRDYVESTRRDIEEMYQSLWQLAETHIRDVPLRRLVLTLLARHAAQLKQVPATLNRFYPYVGGLLEHTLSVVHSCLHLADKYGTLYPDLQPPLNRDLLLAGAILHDLGRTVEFGTDVVKVQPTVDGRFLGHVLLGRDLIRDSARELGDVNPELVRLLEHMVLSHLTLPEWGSPRLPLIPEVLILHHADDLDAKLEMYARRLQRDHEPGPFTARDPNLGKSLYKGRSV